MRAAAGNNDANDVVPAPGDLDTLQATRLFVLRSFGPLAAGQDQGAYKAQMLVKQRRGVERGGKIEAERRSYISLRALLPEAFADAVRSHWAIESNLHWTLDVTFKEDQSRLCAGHGAKNMAVVRHFALNLGRQASDKRSIKRRRKRASYDPKYLHEILQPPWR